jgi:hypothetical protein
VKSIWSESDQISGRSHVGLHHGHSSRSATDVGCVARSVHAKQALFWEQDFRACASTLAMTVPFDIVETGFRPVAPSSELMASLNADNKSGWI